MELLYTARFLRSFRKLPEAIRNDCHHAIELFKRGVVKEIHLYRLHGKLKKYHAFSANFSCGVIIRKEKKKIYFIDVGPHTIYEQYTK